MSEQHEAVFIGGLFESSLRGSGHAFVVAVTPAVPFAVASEPGSPASSAVRLSLVGPNPFRSQTALSLPKGGPVEASLFDVLGRRVAVLHDGVLTAGTHTLAVDGTALPAGVYVARVVGASFTASAALTVVR